MKHLKSGIPAESDGKSAKANVPRGTDESNQQNKRGKRIIPVTWKCHQTGKAKKEIKIAAFEFLLSHRRQVFFNGIFKPFVNLFIAIIFRYSIPF
jgi:hypothetical protein